jgi:nicotinate-nucleotide pyrophosphorylase (carboxylating)
VTPVGHIGRLLHAAGLDPAAVERLVADALAEDLGGGTDVTTEATVPFGQTSVARFVTRTPGVVAGLPVVLAVLARQLGGRPDVDVCACDGDRVVAGQPLLVTRGDTRGLLTAERTALNLLGLLSGVATTTRQWVDAVAGTGAAIRDTRKTAPGLRVLQKYAVRCGGGRNHRMGLSDAALVKDNHILAAGGIAAAFAAIRSRRPDLEVEVECDTVSQVREAVNAGADLVLLDNMPPDLLREAVAAARAIAPVRLEASGRLTLANARAVAETGVDYLAVGALTHSAPALDVGLDLAL